MSSGGVFQTRGPATVKARLPTVESLTGGISRRLVPAERNVRRPGRSATGTRGPKYRGALPLRTACEPCVFIIFMTTICAYYYIISLVCFIHACMLIRCIYLSE